MVFLKAIFNFYQIKHKKLSLFSLKLIQISIYHRNLFEYAFHIKIKKIQVINMDSRKKDNHGIYWNIFLLSQNTLQTKSQQNYQIIFKIGSKNIQIKNSNQNNQGTSQVITFLPQVFSSKIYIDFQKGNVQWLTPQLTTTFAKITQPVAMQNTFVTLFLDNFSQWNKLDIKTQRVNPTEMNFATVNCNKIRKKRLCRYSFILSVNG